MLDLNCNLLDFHNVYKQILEFDYDGYYAESKARILYTWQKASSLIESKSSVVEIGVGPMAVLAKELTGATVECVDLHDSQSPLCKHFNIPLHISDIQCSQIPFPDNSIDLMFLLEVIEHLCMYPCDLLDQIFRKLKEGGYLVVSSVNFLRISNRIRILSGKSPLINYFERTPDGRNHIREFVPDEMSYYMKKSGFDIIENSYFAAASETKVVSTLLHLLYLYPAFRNYFLLIGRK